MTSRDVLPIQLLVSLEKHWQLDSIAYSESMLRLSDLAVGVRWQLIIVIVGSLALRFLA